LSFRAALIPGVDVTPVSSLADLVNHLLGVAVTNLQEVRGQEHVKRAMEVAAAGGHNVMTLWTINRLRFACISQRLNFVVRASIANLGYDVKQPNGP